MNAPDSATLQQFFLWQQQQQQQQPQMQPQQQQPQMQQVQQQQPVVSQQYALQQQPQAFQQVAPPTMAPTAAPIDESMAAFNALKDKKSQLKPLWLDFGIMMGYINSATAEELNKNTGITRSATGGVKRTAATAQSAAAAPSSTPMCPVCNVRPCHVDANGVHPTCGKTCRAKAEAAGQKFGGPKKVVNKICKAPGCTKPVYVNETTGVPGDYCGKYCRDNS